MIILLTVKQQGNICLDGGIKNEWRGGGMGEA